MDRCAKIVPHIAMAIRGGVLWEELVWEVLVASGADSDTTSTVLDGPVIGWRGGSS